MLKVRNGNYYQQKLQNNYFQPKVLLLAQPLSGGSSGLVGGMPFSGNLFLHVKKIVKTNKQTSK